MNMGGASRARLASIQASLAAMRDAHSSHVIDARISRAGRWRQQLFKRVFLIDPVEGELSTTILQCERQHVILHLDPGAEYAVQPAAGECHLEVSGSNGGRFRIKQSGPDTSS
jgi:hypothetical protein